MAVTTERSPGATASGRSRSSFPRRRLRTFVHASPQRVSLRGSRPKVASCIRWETPSRRRASSWRRWRRSCATGAPSTTFGRVEARLNALPQFVTEIDDLDIHFIHVKSRHENALPVILIHGWPGSVVEMLSVVGPLTDPTAHGGSAEDAFDVVIPSMPGYGLSGKPTVSGWGPEHIASASVELMRRLGYTRFVAQGGDWGAVIVDLMGVQAPPELVAIHSNMPGVLPPEIAPGFAPLVVAPTAGRSLGRGAALLRAGRLRVHEGDRLRRRDAPASADALRDRRLARRAGRLDRWTTTPRATWTSPAPSSTDGLSAT